MVKLVPTLNKTAIPRSRVRHISRRHLLDFLHAHLSSRVTLLSTAAGYGKTSLLISFADEAPAVACWYSIDAQDNEATEFFSYLLGAIRRKFPGLGRGFERFLGRSQQGSLQIDDLIGVLVNDLETMTPDRVLIILDDYHHVSANPEIAHMMKSLISRLPVHCSLLIATRVDPDLDLPLYAARRELAVLDTEALKMTPTEVGRLFTEVYGVELSGEDAQKMVDRTNGWCALVALEGEVRTRSLGRKRSLVVPHWSMEYLFSEVLETQPQEIRQFLLRTSVLENLTDYDCRRLVEGVDVKTCLQYLEKVNLLATSHEGPEEWFRYTEVLRRFLEEQLKTEDPELYRELHTRAGVFDLGKRNYKPAFEHFTKAGNFLRASELIELVGEALIESGGMDTVRQWLDCIPGDIRSARPKLMLLQARVQFFQGEPDKAVSNAERARGLFRGLRDREGEVKALLGMAFFHRHAGDWDAAMAVMEEASSIARSADDLVAAEVYYYLAVDHSLLGRYQKSIECYKRAGRLFSASVNGEGSAWCARGLGYVYTKLCRLEEAMHHYKQAADYWKARGNESGEASAMADISTVYRYQGNLGLALEFANRALAKARRSVALRAEGAALMQLGDLHMDFGSYERAKSRLDEALEIFRRLDYPLEEALTLDLLGNLHRITGESSVAKEVFMQGMGLAQRHQWEETEGAILTSLGILNFEEGNLVTAEDQLGRAL
ncbi:MAG: tetratricopeptide repeat protein, partial [Dehalococcoidia bacterium]